MGCWAWNTATCSAMAGVYPPTRQPRIRGGRWRSISAWCAVNALGVALKLAEDAEQRAITIRTNPYWIRLILTISSLPRTTIIPLRMYFLEVGGILKSGNKIKLEPLKAQWPSTHFTCPSRREAEHARRLCCHRLTFAVNAWRMKGTRRHAIVTEWKVLGSDAYRTDAGAFLRDFSWFANKERPRSACDRLGRLLDPSWFTAPLNHLSPQRALLTLPLSHRSPLIITAAGTRNTSATRGNRFTTSGIVNRGVDPCEVGEMWYVRFSPAPENRENCYYLLKSPVPRRMTRSIKLILAFIAVISTYP